MLQWEIQDDQSLTHRFTLLNSYFIASAPFHILCPQHVAQGAQDIMLGLLITALSSLQRQPPRIVLLLRQFHISKMAWQKKG